MNEEEKNRIRNIISSHSIHILQSNITCIPNNVQKLKITNYDNFTKNLNSQTQSIIPKSIKELSLFLRQEEIPENFIVNSIIKLKIYGIEFLKKNIIPNSVTELSLISLNIKIDDNAIPDSVTNLYIDNIQPLEITENLLPKFLKKLSIMKGLNPINFNLLPNTLESLTIHSKITKMEIDILPKSLTHLDIIIE